MREGNSRSFRTEVLFIMDFINLQIATIKEMLNWRVSLDILLITAAIYALYQFLRVTGTWKIASGIMVAGGIFVIARLLNLKGIVWIYSFLSPIILISLIIIFQPEIRKILERTATLMGKQPRRQETKLAFVLSEATFELARKRHGAIMVLPGKDAVKLWVSEGISLDAVVSFPLMVSLFDPNSPGHDGAVLIENDRAAAYAVRLPLSDTDSLPKEYGTRHYAGLGLSEVTDALVIVVSEERGRVTLFHRGTMEVIEHKEMLSARITHHLLSTATTTLKPRFTRKNLRLKEIGVSFFLAFLFWSTVVLTQSELRESSYTIPIDYINIPEGVSVVAESISEVRVHVLGQRSDLQRIVESRLRVRVDLSGASPGKKSVVLANRNVVLPSGLKVTAIEPSSIEIVLE